VHSLQTITVSTSVEAVCNLPACVANRLQGQKYLVQLEENNKEIKVLKEDVRNLYEENRVLRHENHELNKEVKTLTAAVTDIKQDVRQILGLDSTRRNRLLVGQIAYSFLHHLNKEFIVDNDRRYTTISDILDASQKVQELNTFLNGYGIQDYDYLDELLQEMKEKRLEDAHPTRMTQAEQENPASLAPTTDQLKELVVSAYRSNAQSSRKKKALGLLVVDALAKLAFDHGTEILDSSS